VEKWGEERVLSGEYPGNARRRASRLTVAPLEPETPQVTSVEANGDGSWADPAATRPALAQLAAANLDGLQRALLDAALSATTTRWATVDCDDCGARSRVELPVPDVRSRLQAIETLLAQALGRPGQADEQPAGQRRSHPRRSPPKPPASPPSPSSAPRPRSSAAAALHGGRAVVREKLVALSTCERRILRQALDELESV
jgi:hypothetical protein